MLKLCLVSYGCLGTAQRGRVRSRVAAGFSDEGRPSGGQCLGHSPSVGGWSVGSGGRYSSGEVSRADEVRPVGLPKSVGCEAVGHRDGFYMECGVQTSGPPKVPHPNSQNL